MENILSWNFKIILQDNLTLFPDDPDGKTEAQKRDRIFLK